MRYATHILAIVTIFAQASSAAIAETRSLAEPPTARIEVIDRGGEPTTELTDGDAIRLRITLDKKTDQPSQAVFTFEGGAHQISTCAIPAGATACETEPLTTLGWYWSDGGVPSATRSIQASVNDVLIAETASVTVAPRPVVMVHGFASSWQAWVEYLGPEGYLASMGIKGFAVGDGQVEGAMNTGSLDNPAGATNTIAENAAIVGAFIENVKRVTGAEQVDLIAHSMGGLISRYYIDRVMGERDVAQLIMLGSPMAGTDCANLPASLGFYLPATLEIRPSYVRGIFNQQITHRHGVQFYALAGTQILDAVSAPCTEAPTDVAVSLSSVTAIPLEASQMPLLHTDLNVSEQVFHEFVAPLLQKTPEEFVAESDPAPSTSASPPLQFSRVFAGHLEQRSSNDVEIGIEAGITVASFALYDTTRSLEVVVRGASGNVINLSPETNGLIVVDDPSTLVYLGYGFQNPKPGVWKVTLQTTDRTPAGGADYALSAQYIGGAILDATASTLLPAVNETVALTASLNLGGQALALDSAHAIVHRPNGATETLPLTIVGSRASANWAPTESGLYGLDFQVTGRAPDETVIERAAFLTIEAQPANPPTTANLAMIGAGVAAITIAAIGAVALIFAVLWVARKKIRSR